LLGDDKVTSVQSELGIEQEFFIIDRGFYYSRPDLVACGRTLLGAKPPKGQELEDHYFGSVERRVLALVQDAEWALWKLGVPMKTRHNEVAPSQYEMAPIFEDNSVASDHNMLAMEIIRELAVKHGFACLLHEKPFAGINGSGKHNNWSFSTNTGENLTDPGDTPAKNARFMVVLAALLRAVHKNGDLLRASVTVPGNDHRLGANEAPPAIMSVYIGQQLAKVVSEIIGSEEGMF
jgi:glutamine synthetase